MKFIITGQEIFELISREENTFSDFHFMKDLEGYDKAILKAEELFDTYDNIQGQHEKSTEKWTQYKAIKEFSEDFMYIVKLKTKHDPNDYWKRKHNRLIERKEQIEYLEVDVENVLDYLGIQHVRRHCACPIHEGNNKNAFSFTGPLYKCFACEAKGNGFQLALTLGLTKQQIKHISN